MTLTQKMILKMLLKNSKSLKGKRKMPEKRNNKFVWRYKFVFHNDDVDDEMRTYSIETEEGFQIADYYADNNRRWDAFTHMDYLGKTKVKENDKYETVS